MQRSDDWSRTVNVMYREIVPYRIARCIDFEVEGTYGPYLDDTTIAIINGIVVKVHDDMVTLKVVSRSSERGWQNTKRDSVKRTMFFMK